MAVCEFTALRGNDRKLGHSGSHAELVIHRQRDRIVKLAGYPASIEKSKLMSTLADTLAPPIKTTK